MTIQFTEQQLHAVDAAAPESLQIVDPRTKKAYVLIPAEDYESIREIIDDERRQKAIRKVAIRNAVGRMEDQP